MLHRLRLCKIKSNKAEAEEKNISISIDDFLDKVIKSDEERMSSLEELNGCILEITVILVILLKKIPQRNITLNSKLKYISRNYKILNAFAY